MLWATDGCGITRDEICNLLRHLRQDDNTLLKNKYPVKFTDQTYRTVWARLNMIMS